MLLDQLVRKVAARQQEVQYVSISVVLLQTLLHILQVCNEADLVGQRLKSRRSRHLLEKHSFKRVLLERIDLIDL